MEAHDMPEAVKLILEQRGWTQDDLAGEWDVSQPWVSQLIRGKMDIKINKAIALLARVGWELVIRPKREESDPVKRRAFTASMITTSAGMAAESVGLSVYAPSANIAPYQDPAFVDGLAQRLTSDMYECGGISIASTALLHTEKLKPVIGSRDLRLQRSAANLTCEAIWVLYDAGRFRAAEYTGSNALALSKKAQDPETQSRVYSALAQVSLARGQADRGLMYAENGLKLPDTSSAQRAWLKVRLSRSLAHIRGHESTAQRTLDNARELDSLPVFEAADMAGCVGAALTDLRVYDEALACLDQAVQNMQQRSPLLYGLTLGHQISTAIHASQPSIAADRMMLLARVFPLVSSSRLDRHMTKILVATRHWGRVPEVRNARDQLRSVGSRDHQRIK